MCVRVRECWGRGAIINHSYWMGHMLGKDCPIPFSRAKVRAASLPVNLSGARDADQRAERSAGFTGAGGNLARPIKPCLPNLAHIFAAGDAEQRDGYQKERDSTTKSSWGSFSGFYCFYSVPNLGHF